MARRDDTPRDLLFGLLALQVGLIDQDQLIAAFGAWSRVQGKTLAEVLFERGSIDSESRTLLAAMAEKHLKIHGGDTEKSLASLGASPSTRKKLVALSNTELTGSLPAVGPTAVMDDPFRTASYASRKSTPEGGRFRVLRPHAKGGLGAVFVALDVELNREVALKEILDHHADNPLSRTRFLIEAEITGGLEHPGIVPVYGLGHYGDGRPYYAMRFIRGESFKDTITAFHGDEGLKLDPGKRSLALRKLLRRFVDVCNAIDYAHGRGILHRDLKPSNVIVGKHGETLVVDWGLAKSVASCESGVATDERTLIPSSSSGSAETLPGSAMGTPAYMSPEQACGDLERLGPGTDVYSLGATLYYLLTGRPSFDGTDIGAILRDVQKGTFPPPRELDPTIDRALEAVCLKAMATRPEDRYSTARALADDVERWAADEPVTAWQEPASVRAGRWMRRNRTAVTAASVAVLVAVIGLASVLAVESQANTRLAAKNNELDKANRLKDEANAGLVEANERVQARFDLAREAIRSFQTGVTEDDMLKGEELKGLRDKLLRSAAGFYEKLEKLLQGQADRPSRAILAQSYSELGTLTEAIGIKPEAEAIFRKSLAIRRELANQLDAKASANLELAESLNDVGSQTYHAGDPVGALTTFEEARSLALPLTTGPDSTVQAREVLGITLHRIAWILSNIGRPGEANEAIREALTIRRKLAEEDPEVTRFRGNLADTLGALAKTQSETGDHAQALESTREALAIQRKLTEDYPKVTKFRSKLAISHHNIGLLFEKLGAPQESLNSNVEAVKIRRQLAQDFPAVTEFRDNQAESQLAVGNRLAGLGRQSEALAAFRKALSIYRKLADDHPTVPSFRNGLANSLHNIGILEAQLGNYAAALVSLRQALVVRRNLAKDHSAITEYRQNESVSYFLIGQLLGRTGEPDEAMISLLAALKIQIQLADENPSDPQNFGRVADTYSEIGDSEMRTGRWTDASESYGKALSIGQKLVKDHPDIKPYQQGLAVTYRKMGETRTAAGDLTGAIAEYRSALAIMKDLPDTIPWLYDKACCHSLLARIILRTESKMAKEEAESEAFAAVSTLRRVIEIGYRDLKHIQADFDFDTLRTRSDFQLLMMDLAFPACSFAEGFDGR